MKVLLACFACMVIGCATASQPTESPAASQQGTLVVIDEYGQQLYNGPACPVGCVSQYGVTNPYLLETDIEYLQLMMWRYRGATEDALEAGSGDEAQTKLTEAHNDALRLIGEYTEWWNAHRLDQDCYYCGLVCQEMNLLLLHSPVTDSHPICPDPAP